MPEALPLPRVGGVAWALFLDVDGTLLDLAGHPDAVVVPSGLASLLAGLRRALGGAMALVSGRSLVSLDALLGGAGLDAAGCHGAEIRIGGRMEILAAADGRICRVAERLVRLLDGVPRTMVEAKARSVALHYRPPVLDVLWARGLAMTAMAADAPMLKVLEGKRVVEILPVGASKGAAIAYFLDRPPFSGRLPVFVGDDVTDEDGFREVNRRGGISIRVGDNGTTEARFQVAAVVQVAEWLAGPVCKALGCGKE